MSTDAHYHQGQQSCMVGISHKYDCEWRVAEQQSLCATTKHDKVKMC